MKKGLSYALNVIFIVIVGIVVSTMLITLVNIKLAQKKERDLPIIIDELNYAKCSAYCATCFDDECMCNVEDKEVACSFFVSTENLINELNTLEYSYESPLPEDATSSLPKKCKLADVVGISERVKESIKKNIKDKAIPRYKDLVEKYAERYGIPTCLIYTIIAIESSGGDNKVIVMKDEESDKEKEVSCGITMITPETYRELTGESCNDEECCEKLKKDDELAIKLSVRYIVSSLTQIKGLISTYNYPDNDLLFMAYVFAYYNGGFKALTPSKDCSLESCNDLKETLQEEFGEVENVPAFMCSYNAGGYGRETQPYVRKALYAYQYCKKLLSD